MKCVALLRGLFIIKHLTTRKKISLQNKTENFVRDQLGFEKVKYHLKLSASDDFPFFIERPFCLDIIVA